MARNVRSDCSRFGLDDEIRAEAPRRISDDAAHAGPEPQFDTLAVHAGAEPDELTGAVSPPIYQTSTYAQDGVGRPRARLRVRALPEPDPRAARAGGRGARGRRRTGSRSPAARRRPRRSPSSRRPARRSSSATTSTAARSAISSGSTGRRGVDARYADLAAGPDVALGGADRRGRALVWFETPTNPTSSSSTSPRPPRPSASGRPQAGDARPLVVVDNTFASPALQRPLDARGGHRLPLGDEVPRAATRTRSSASRSPNDDAIAERLRFLQNAMGGVPGPLDCFLVLRGLRTLPPAGRAARARTPWRSPASSPAATTSRGSSTRASPTGRTPTRGAALAARQMRAGGGMVSFIPAPARRPVRRGERAIAICEATRAVHAGRVAWRRGVAHRDAGGR